MCQVLSSKAVPPPLDHPGAGQIIVVLVVVVLVVLVVSFQIYIVIPILYINMLNIQWWWGIIKKPKFPK